MSLFPQCLLALNTVAGLGNELQPGGRNCFITPLTVTEFSCLNFFESDLNILISALQFLDFSRDRVMIYLFTSVRINGRVIVSVIWVCKGVVFMKFLHLRLILRFLLPNSFLDVLNE